MQNIEHNEQDTQCQKKSRMLKKSNHNLADVTNTFQSNNDLQISENFQNKSLKPQKENFKCSPNQQHNDENSLPERSHSQYIAKDHSSSHQTEDNPTKLARSLNKSKPNKPMDQNDSKDVTSKPRCFETETEVREYLNHKSTIIRANDSLIDALMKNCELNDEAIPSFFKWKSYLDEDNSVNCSKKELSEKEWMNLDAELLHNTFLDNDGYKVGTRDQEIYEKLSDVKINKTSFPSLHRWLKYMTHIKHIKDNLR